MSKNRHDGHVPVSRKDGTKVKIRPVHTQSGRCGRSGPCPEIVHSDTGGSFLTKGLVIARPLSADHAQRNRTSSCKDKPEKS